MPAVILASSSPRRRAILEQIGVEYEVIPPDIDETPDPTLAPVDLAVSLARRKALAVRHALALAHTGRSDRPSGGRFILAADTVVAIGDGVMGKPTDRDEARAFLRALSGRRHTVHSAVAVMPPAAALDAQREVVAAACDSTDVYFASLAEDEISWYLDTAEWQGVAGGYRIQEKGACLVERLDGSYSAVVGLPIRLVYSMLAANGFAFT